MPTSMPARQEYLGPDSQPFDDSDAAGLGRLRPSSVLIFQEPITAKALTTAVQNLLATPRPEKASAAAG